MKKYKFTGFVIAAVMLLPGLCFAGTTIVSGMFDGSEAKTTELRGSCLDPPYNQIRSGLAYQTVEIAATASGFYTLADALGYHRMDVVVNVYQGAFNPDSPETGLLTPIGIRITGNVSLTAGTSYTLVVQQFCLNLEGAWAVTFEGPGEVISEKVVTGPEWTQGVITGQEQTADFNCGLNLPHQVTGPIQVATSGVHYFTDVSRASGIDICVFVYDGGFNRFDYTENLLAKWQDSGNIELETNTDYYFVVTPLNTELTGEFFYVLAPPAPFRIQSPMSGSWYNPATSGQGFLIDVLDSINQMFVGWYTYDIERPADDVTAIVGDPGHRWFTAQGPFTGKVAELDVYVTSGMIFDSGTPPPNDSVKDGTMTIEFFDCYTGQVSYDIESVGVAGDIPIERISNDAVALCEFFIDGPGQPGPL